MGRRATLWMMVGLVALSLGVRLPRLGKVGYQPDELWTAEIATGRGSVHVHLPQNQFIARPDIFSLENAPPWWHVWTHMQVTHPPLYFVLLRLWIDLLGTGDFTERLLSALASTAAVLLLFDTAARLNGRAVAIWAAVLMAIAEPQVDHARLARNYALLMMTALAAANLLVRIEQSTHLDSIVSPPEPDRRRRQNWLIASLAATVLMTLLTHYFCLGALLGMFAYAAVRFTGSVRRRTLAAFVVGGALFTLLWGPFMWEQRHLFATTDEATLFLQENDPAHLVRSLHRLLMVPAGMLVGPRGVLLGVPTLLGMLYLLPLWKAGRQRGLLFWMVWLWAVPGPLLLMDLFRQTAHLGFIRYTMLAGPAVYVLIPALAGMLPPAWMRHMIPAAASILCATSLTEVFHNPVVADPHLVIQQLPVLTGTDRLVFSAKPGMGWKAAENYLMVSRYDRRLSPRIGIVDRPAPPTMVGEALASSRLFVLSSSTVDELYWGWPGMTLRRQSFPGRVVISVWAPPPAPSR